MNKPSNEQIAIYLQEFLSFPSQGINTYAVNPDLRAYLKDAPPNLNVCINEAFHRCQIALADPNLSAEQKLVYVWETMAVPAGCLMALIAELDL